MQLAAVASLRALIDDWCVRGVICQAGTGLAWFGWRRMRPCVHPILLILPVLVATCFSACSSYVHAVCLPASTCTREFEEAQFLEFVAPCFQQLASLLSSASEFDSQARPAHGAVCRHQLACRTSGFSCSKQESRGSLWWPSAFHCCYLPAAGGLLPAGPHCGPAGRRREAVRPRSAGPAAQRVAAGGGAEPAAHPGEHWGRGWDSRGRMLRWGKCLQPARADNPIRPLRSSCSPAQVLVALQRLVHALGAESPAAYPLVLPVLKLCTDPNQPDELNLLEDGLQLW